MPAGPTSEVDGESNFLMDPNHLHIWPRHSFMLIALPNKVRYSPRGWLRPSLLPSLSYLVLVLTDRYRWIYQDRTFTCTLFAPTSEFDKLDTEENTLAWFRTHFPDALPLIGEGNLLKDCRKNPRSPLMTVKVRFAQSITASRTKLHVIDFSRPNHTITKTALLSWEMPHTPWCRSMGKVSTAAWKTSAYWTCY